jgi:Acyl-CoA dehydrogenase, middle domain
MPAVAIRFDETDDALTRLAASFASRAEASDRRAQPASESLAEAARSGFHALTVPRALGGEGAGLAKTVSIARRLGAADPAATLILAMTWIQHAHATLARRWPDKIHHEIARDALNGRGLINALRVEPELGTVLRGGMPTTTARLTDDGWRITGRKIYSTGASVLDWYSVFARTDDEEPQVGYFLVRAGAPGIRIEESWDHLGMCGSDSHDVIFEDTPIPRPYAVDLRPPDSWLAGAAGRDRVVLAHGLRHLSWDRRRSARLAHRLSQIARTYESRSPPRDPRKNADRARRNRCDPPHGGDFAACDGTESRRSAGNVDGRGTWLGQAHRFRGGDRSRAESGRVDRKSGADAGPSARASPSRCSVRTCPLAAKRFRTQGCGY